MRNQNDIHDWQEDFNEFCQAEEVPPPAHISEQIKSKIRKSLALMPWIVFGKLCLITLVGGGGTLLVCPQFALGHPGHDTVISRLFHSFGPMGCTLACGATFIGVSILLAVLALRKDEVGVIYRKKFVQVPAISIIFLGVFVCAGAQVFLEVALVWWLGGVVTGLAALEIGWRLRTYVASSSFA